MNSFCPYYIFGNATSLNAGKTMQHRNGRSLKDRRSISNLELPERWHWPTGGPWVIGYWTIRPEEWLVFRPDNLCYGRISRLAPESPAKRSGEQDAKNNDADQPQIFLFHG